jgi:predicted MFS family arabinose efflux permease
LRFAWCGLQQQLSTSPAIPAILKIVGLVVFASTIFTRAVDPLIPKIATDLAIDVKTAALLSTAFTFPYALVQPVLGAFGDHFGKTKLMNICLLVVALAALVCAVATSFPLLVAMRVLAGCVAGGLFPIALALLGDLVRCSNGKWRSGGSWRSASPAISWAPRSPA